MAEAFGRKPGTAGWNAVADVDISETIKMVDVAKVTKSFGQATNPQ